MHFSTPSANMFRPLFDKMFGHFTKLMEAYQAAKEETEAKYPIVSLKTL